MTEDKGPALYTIPDNFIDEGRILKGMVKTRGFIEGLLLAAPAIILAWVSSPSAINAKIGTMVALAGPLFLLGYTGFNGDPFSTSIVNAYRWYKARGVMLYNYSTKALAKTPLDAMMEREQPRDKVADIVDEYRAKRKAKAAAFRYVEGQTFQFAEDTELQGIYADGRTDIAQPRESVSVFEVVDIPNENHDIVSQADGLAQSVVEPPVETPAEPEPTQPVVELVDEPPQQSMKKSKPSTRKVDGGVDLSIDFAEETP